MQIQTRLPVIRGFCVPVHQLDALFKSGLGRRWFTGLGGLKSDV
jgi:hypothetical protein